MLTTGNDVFVQLPSETKDRLLHPGTVVDTNGNQLVAHLEEDLGLEAGQDILIYFTLSGGFVRQPARVGTSADIEIEVEQPSGTFVNIEKTGEPVSADDRQAFRVSCIVEGLAITFGDSDDCSLVDVSSTGFGVISPDKYEIGDIVTAAPKYEDFEGTGNVKIQSAVKSRKGGFRYGVSCVDRDLEGVVQQICMAVQRNQLRRLAAQV